MLAGSSPGMGENYALKLWYEPPPKPSEKGATVSVSSAPSLVVVSTLVVGPSYATQMISVAPATSTFTPKISTSTTLKVSPPPDRESQSCTDAPTETRRSLVPTTTSKTRVITVTIILSKAQSSAPAQHIPSTTPELGLTIFSIPTTTAHPPPQNTPRGALEGVDTIPPPPSTLSDPPSARHNLNLTLSFLTLCIGAPPTTPQSCTNLRNQPAPTLLQTLLPSTPTSADALRLLTLALLFQTSLSPIPALTTAVLLGLSLLLLLLLASPRIATFIAAAAIAAGSHTLLVAINTLALANVVIDEESGEGDLRLARGVEFMVLGAVSMGLVILALAACIVGIYLRALPAAAPVKQEEEEVVSPNPYQRSKMAVEEERMESIDLHDAPPRRIHYNPNIPPSRGPLENRGGRPMSGCRGEARDGITVPPPNHQAFSYV